MANTYTYLFNQEKGEENQITKISKQRGDITANLIEIKRIITSNYYELLYANKLSNLDEMDKFLGHKLLLLTQEEFEYLNWPITSRDWSKNQKITKKKSGPDGFTG